MSLRILACLLFVAFFSFYAWKNWFVSLCAAILLMAVVQHPDFKQIKNIGGIQGLNPWNLLLMNVVAAWWFRPSAQRSPWDMPRNISRYLKLLLLAMFIGFIRMTMDPSGIKSYSFGYAISECLINTIKWVVPGLLLFDACRDPKRMRIAIMVVLGLYFLLAIQVIRWVPLRAAVASGEELSHLAYKRCLNEIGFNRVTLSMMLGGASWALVACLVLCSNWKQKCWILAAAVTVTLGQSLTGGRTGYVSWALTGLVLCLVKWRKYLPLLPIAVLILFAFVPSVRDRLLMGFGENAGGNSALDLYTVTSGRNVAWPYVIETIKTAPLFGYGRMAMTRKGISQQIMNDTEGGEVFEHPHNAYLEIVIDNGVLVLIVVIVLFYKILRYSFMLFANKVNSMASCVGGATCALVITFLIGSFGGQTFYPREGAVGMWSLIFVMLRAYIEYSRSQHQEQPIFRAKTASFVYE